MFPLFCSIFFPFSYSVSSAFLSFVSLSGSLFLHGHSASFSYSFVFISLVIPTFQLFFLSPFLTFFTFPVVFYLTSAPSVYSNVCLIFLHVLIFLLSPSFSLSLSSSSYLYLPPFPSHFPLTFIFPFLLIYLFPSSSSLSLSFPFTFIILPFLLIFPLPLFSSLSLSFPSYLYHLHLSSHIHLIPA